MESKVRRLLFSLALLCALAASEDENLLVSQECLSCMCKTLGCDMEQVCTPDKQVCGPFLISQLYWMDANKPVIPGDLPDDYRAFERCASDPFCSAETIEGYMNRYKKDCDGDGRVDCADFMMLHFYGPSCKATYEADPAGVFKACWTPL